MKDLDPLPDVPDGQMFGIMQAKHLDGGLKNIYIIFHPGVLTLSKST